MILPKILTRKNILKTFIFLFLFILVVFLLVRDKSPLPAQTKVVVPGKTTTKTLIENEPPFASAQKGGTTEYYVGDPNSRDNSTYGERSGIVDYYLERNRTKFLHSDFDAYVQEYGQPDLIRYNNWYTYSKFQVYVFLKPGVAITAHPDSKALIEEWHFVADLSPEQFDASYQQLFSATPPTPTNQF